MYFPTPKTTKGITNNNHEANKKELSVYQLKINLKISIQMK